MLSSFGNSKKEVTVGPIDYCEDDANFIHDWKWRNVMKMSFILRAMPTSIACRLEFQAFAVMLGVLLTESSSSLYPSSE